MSKQCEFKEGDMVRCINNDDWGSIKDLIEIGKLYRVSAVHHGNYPLVELEGIVISSAFYAHNFARDEFLENVMKANGIT